MWNSVQPTFTMASPIKKRENPKLKRLTIFNSAVFEENVEVLLLLCCPASGGVKNFNIGHNFLISDPIYFILGHNVPLGKTSDMPYFCVTLTSE